MKILKKGLSILLVLAFVVLCFAGCSGSEKADEINDKTMLIAYTQENSPFLYTNDKGELDGFDVKIFETIFKNIKNDYKNYKFVQVEEGYRIGEDTAYTDDDGNEYIAYVMIGGIQKNSGSINRDFTFSENVIDNRIITVTQSDSDIKTYADLSGAKVGIITETAKTALDKNAAVRNSLGSVEEYTDAEVALRDLYEKKIDALIGDEFTLRTTKVDVGSGLYLIVSADSEQFTELEGELDTISYAYAFKKYDWWADSINEAIYELKSLDYNDKDELTPIVEEYFGYNASNFNYNPV